MRSADKFLVGIVAGIGLLVVAAFIVVLTQPEPEYQNSDSPEAIVHNYLLALRQDDFDRAYQYVSHNLIGYPRSVLAFQEDIDDSYRFSGLRQDVTIDVQSSTIRAETASVEVLEGSFTGGDLLSSGSYERRFDMKLRLEDGEWRLVDGERYWSTCWSQRTTYCN